MRPQTSYNMQSKLMNHLCKLYFGAYCLCVRRPMSQLTNIFIVFIRTIFLYSKTSFISTSSVCAHLHTFLLCCRHLLGLGGKKPFCTCISWSWCWFFLVTADPKLAIGRVHLPSVGCLYWLTDLSSQMECWKSVLRLSSVSLPSQAERSQRSSERDC